MTLDLTMRNLCNRERMGVSYMHPSARSRNPRPEADSKTPSVVADLREDLIHPQRQGNPRPREIVRPRLFPFFLIFFLILERFWILVSFPPFRLVFLSFLALRWYRRPPLPSSFYLDLFLLNVILRDGNCWRYGIERIDAGRRIIQDRDPDAAFASSRTLA
jgi:hypothetical protein